MCINRPPSLAMENIIIRPKVYFTSILKSKLFILIPKKYIFTYMSGCSLQSHFAWFLLKDPIDNNFFVSILILVSSVGFENILMLVFILFNLFHWDINVFTYEADYVSKIHCVKFSPQKTIECISIDRHITVLTL